MQTVLIFYGAILPAVTALILLTAMQPWRLDSASRARWAAGAALAAAFCITQAQRIGWPAFPPAEAWQWLAWLAPGAAVVGVVDPALWRPNWMRRALRLAVSVAVAMLVAPAFHDHLIGARAALAAALFALWCGIDDAARPSNSAVAAAILMLAAIGAAVVLERSANAKLACLAGSLAAVCGAAMLLAWCLPQVSIAGGAAVYAIALPGLLLNGQATTDTVPTISFVLVATAPLAIRINGIQFVRRLRPAARATTALVAAVIPLGIAAWLAFQATADQLY